VRERPGRCRWWGCTYEEPCPGSCGWANREQTLCTACVDVDREWKRQTRLAHRPNMRRAFFRGFMAGSDDERADSQDSPYARRETRAYWQIGFDAGRRHAR